MFTDPMYPCYGQTEESIKEWMMEFAAPGVVVAVRSTQGGLWEYRLDEIRSVNEPTKGRIYLKSGTFYFNGKLCFHPKGQTRMIVLTKAVREAVAAGRTWFHGNAQTQELPDVQRALLESSEARSAQ